ncbi:TPA: HNH endonuclease [Escherichia coli]|nr:HNH endonuclease [Escherichia coli]
MTKERDWNEVFEYIDGRLIWKIKPCNNVKEYSPAGSTRNDGYLHVGFMKKLHMVHRIIWEMHNGKIPDGMEIDHVNHNKMDNRIENLRLVRHGSNQRNKSKQGNNTSGVTGVTWSRRDKKWIAQIMVERKNIHLGYFSDFNSAVAARKNAEKEHRFHKNHGI